MTTQGHPAMASVVSAVGEGQLFSVPRRGPSSLARSDAFSRFINNQTLSNALTMPLRLLSALQARAKRRLAGADRGAPATRVVALLRRYPPFPRAHTRLCRASPSSAASARGPTPGGDVAVPALCCIRTGQDLSGCGYGSQPARRWPRQAGGTVASPRHPDRVGWARPAYRRPPAGFFSLN